MYSTQDKEFAALLRPLTKEEFAEECKDEIKNLKRDLTNTEESTPILEETEKILTRNEFKLNRIPSIPQGDPNLQPFPIPHDSSPSDMRKWVSTWQPFDCQLTPWPCIETKPSELGVTQEIFKGLLRPWLDNWVPFDMEIDGEAAWECLELNLVANDIITKEQGKLIEKRSTRTDMNNRGRMAFRRKQLRHYFKQKYHINEEQISRYDNFTQSLEDSAKEFQTVCSKSDQKMT